MNKQLLNFFDNTKQLHILLCIALLLIIVTMIAPIGKVLINYGGQIGIVTILMYILFKNFTETHNFVSAQKRMKKIKGDEALSENILQDIQYNTIASYVLCMFILLLLVYVIYSVIY